MKIKRLEIMGFKSFMAKTVINFDADLIGVVGPNGCGKSNILDAFLWVMGEQSPRSLRGKKMEDVIFCGSANKKPSSVAEVSLVLENDGVFPASYLNFSEITVTRRLYRDGESEYLINKIPVRLRDVKEVFMDSGARTYAIIEQEEISKIIVSGEQEKRAIIEEAAGITKYKIRKEESSRKLEKTEQNLLRLNDIIVELEKQLSQLEKQAKKAAKYREIKNELKEIEIKTSVFNYLNIDKDLSILREKLKSIESRKEDLEVNISKFDLNLETKKAEKNEIEEKLTMLQEETVVLNTNIHKAKAKLEVIEIELRNIDQNKDIRVHELSALNVRLERGNRELEAIENDYISHEEIVNKATEEFKQANDTLNLKLRNYEEMLAELDDKKSKILEIVQREITAKNNITNHSARLEINISKEDKYLSDKEKSESDFIKTKEDLTKLENNLKDFNNQKIKFLESMDSFTQKNKDFIEMLESKKIEKEGYVSKLNEIKSRLEVLFELTKKLDGISNGTRHVVENPNWEPQVKALLADVIETTPEYEKAVGAVLGDVLEALIVDSSSSIIGMINDLKRTEAGVACFLPSNMKRVAQSQEEIFKKSFTDRFLNTKTPTSIINNIKFDPKYSDVINCLFANVYVVNDLNSAIDIWYNAKSTDFTLVTKDGDVLKGNGFVKGGSKTYTETNLLERKREIKALKEEREKMSLLVSVAEEDCQVLETEIQKNDTQIQVIKEEINALDVRMASVSKEFDLVKDYFKRQESRISEINFELDQIRFENMNLRKEVEEANNILKNSDGNKSNLELEVQELKQKIDAFSKEVDSCRVNVTNLQIHVSTLKERFKGVEERKLFLSETLEADTLRVKNLKDEESSSLNRKENLAKELEEIKKKSILDIEALDSVNRKILEVKNSYNEVNNFIIDIESKVKEYRSELTKVIDEQGNLNNKLAESSISTGLIKQRIFDKYEVEILSYVDKYDFTEFNLESENEKIAASNKKLQDLGEVNVLAIEEYDSLTQRHSFLISQREDLTTSIEDLKKAIRKIDDTSKSRFKETFDLINEKFEKFFPILFGGGTAKLVMLNPEDLLNTGLDIVAELPGKNTKAMNLTSLSGGERSLTALSLIFAVYSVRPSPFCMLDEVDASLDDANISKFNEVLKVLNDRTQFVVITHNKKTMEMLNLLYGITMEEPGVSRIVAVRLGELEDKITKNYNIPVSSYRQETLM